MDVYNKHTLFVCVHDLPYWIKRYLVNCKKLHGNYPYGIHLEDEFVNSIEIKIRDYFISTYPGYIEFCLDSDREFIADITIDLYSLGESLMQKIDNQSN